MIENNKLIAEFMGVAYNPQNDVWDVEDKFEGIGWSTELLRYGFSWDWLMPVVEKIEGMLPCDSVITIAYKDCIIPVNEGEFDIQVIGADSKKAAVYKAVVEFIKWYNRQNQ